MSRDSVLIIDNKKNLFLLYILRYRNLNPNIFNGEREVIPTKHATCQVELMIFSLQSKIFFI